MWNVPTIVGRTHHCGTHPPLWDAPSLRRGRTWIGALPGVQEAGSRRRPSSAMALQHEHNRKPRYKTSKIIAQCSRYSLHPQENGRTLLPLVFHPDGLSFNLCLHFEDEQQTAVWTLFHPDETFVYIFGINNKCVGLFSRVKCLMPR